MPQFTRSHKDKCCKPQRSTRRWLPIEAVDGAQQPTDACRLYDGRSVANLVRSQRPTQIARGACAARPVAMA